MGHVKTKIILFLNYFFGLVLVVLSKEIFPEKYFSDSETIKDMISGSAFQFDFFDSFNNTAYFYKILGFDSVLPDWLSGFVSYTIPFVLIVLVCRQQKWEFNIFTSALFFVWNVLLVVYLGVYSKELLAFMAVGILSLLSKSWRGIFLGLLLAAIYAVFFRIYWLIVIGFFCVNLWCLRTRRGLLAMVTIQLIAAFFVLKLANVATGQYLSEVRLNVNVEREDSAEAVTMITNVFDNSSPVHDWMNVVVTWLSLTFPVFLLKTGEVQHILFFLFQIVNTILFIVVAKSLIKKLPDRASMTKERKLQLEVALAWCFAYSFVQGIFEPDFGSFAKHQVILIPMWFFILAFYFQAKNAFSFGTARANPFPPKPLETH